MAVSIVEVLFGGVPLYAEPSATAPVYQGVIGPLKFGCFHKLEVLFCGCSKRKSPTICGPHWGLCLLEFPTHEVGERLGKARSLQLVGGTRFPR